MGTIKTKLTKTIFYQMKNRSQDDEMTITYTNIMKKGNYKIRTSPFLIHKITNLEST